MLARVTLVASVALMFLSPCAIALDVPTASVALDNLSDCESGTLSVTTSGISGGRELWRATAKDAVDGSISLLGEGERSGPQTGYSGTLHFPFLTGPVPYGIVVTLYGYQGTTPPSPATTAEFSVSYYCDTLEVVASGAGAYGTITALPIGARIPTLSPVALTIAALSLALAGTVALWLRTVDRR
jgi:hypothetical protein